MKRPSFFDWDMQGRGTSCRKRGGKDGIKAQDHYQCHGSTWQDRYSPQKGGRKAACEAGQIPVRGFHAGILTLNFLSILNFHLAIALKL